MRNLTSKLFVVAMALALLYFPGKTKAGELSGTWKCGSSIIEFSGKGLHKLLKDGAESTFVVKDGQFEVTGKDGVKQSASYTMEGDKLAVTFGDMTLKYKRK